jgi:hypothetical protein
MADRKYNAWFIHDGRVVVHRLAAADDATAVDQWERLTLFELNCDGWLMTPLGKQLSRRRRQSYYDGYIPEGVE